MEQGFTLKTDTSDGSDLRTARRIHWTEHLNMISGAMSRTRHDAHDFPAESFCDILLVLITCLKISIDH